MTFLSCFLVCMCHTRNSRINWTVVGGNMRKSTSPMRKCKGYLETVCQVSVPQNSDIHTVSSTLSRKAKTNLRGSKIQNYVLIFGKRKEEVSRYRFLQAQTQRTQKTLLNRGIQVTFYKPNKCCWLQLKLFIFHSKTHHIYSKIHLLLGVK